MIVIITKMMILTMIMSTGARISMLLEGEAWRTNRFVLGDNLERWLVIAMVMMVLGPGQLGPSLPRTGDDNGGAGDDDHDRFGGGAGDGVP